LSGDRQRVGRVVRSLTVELGDRSYPIKLGVDTLAGVGKAIARCAPSNRAFVVTVPPVSRRYGGVLQRSLRSAGYRVHRVLVPDGETTKNPRQLSKLWDELIDFGADRSTPVVALGGGVVGDLAGFAAASYLRGVPFIQIPTTVLAMVTLRSLPARQRSAGFAEVIKAAAIWDSKFFERLERDAEGLMELDPKLLIPTLERACAIKAEVVSRDEREVDLRRILNFGHTIAHAIERLGRYRGLLHGEAVAIGMIVAAQKSEQLGLSPAGTAERIRSLNLRFGLPCELPNHPRNAYLDALRVDKKMARSKIQFVALRGIGRAETVPLTPREVLPAIGRRAGSRGALGKRTEGVSKRG